MSHPGHSTTRRESRYPLNGSPGGPQRQFGCFREEKNLLFQPGFEHWTIHCIAQSVCQLQYPPLPMMFNYHYDGGRLNHHHPVLQNDTLPVQLCVYQYQDSLTRAKKYFSATMKESGLPLFMMATLCFVSFYLHSC